MRKILGALIGLAVLGLCSLTTQPASGDVGDVISSFPAPGANPMGLTWDGTCLWVSDPSTHLIYKLDTAGNVLDSLTSPVTFPTGLAWDGTNLWCASDNLEKYKLDTVGNVVSHHISGHGTDDIAWDGTHLWQVSHGENIIYKFDTTVTFPITMPVVSSFESPANLTMGLAWDGTSLWCTSEETAMIYKLDVAGNVVLSFPSPGSSPAGLAYDGTYLWNADRDTLRIYKIDVTPTPPPPFILIGLVGAAIAVLIGIVLWIKR